MSMKKSLKKIGLYAAGFVTILSVIFPQSASAQTSAQSPFQAALQSVLEDAEKGALALAVDYFNNEHEVFLTDCGSTDSSRQRCVETDQGWYLDIAPEVHIDLGEKGLFQALNGKLTGNFVFFDKENLEDAIGVDLGAPTFGPGAVQHVFPVSLGVETTRYFDKTAIVGEVGYVPFDFGGFQFLDNNFKLGINPYIGVFLQGGYKFDTGSSSPTGGAADESSEAADSGILRLKADFNADVLLAKYNFNGNEGSIRLLPWATAWYDVAHNDFYHSVGTIVRMTLPAKESTSIDFKLENGSGEPNFNNGTQVSAGLAFQY